MGRRDYKKVIKDVVHIFKGHIVVGPDGDNSYALYIVDGPSGVMPKPLAEEFGNRVGGYGKAQVSVFYHITDEEHTEDELTKMLVAKMCGVTIAGNAESQYSHRHSELTGYLWTDEKLVIGGHDLQQELRTHTGKWCYLHITHHNAESWEYED